MTTLAGVRRGDVFLAAFRCTDASQVTGLTFTLYGPHRDPWASAVIAPDGSLTGTLAAAPGDIQVQLVSGIAPLSTGDVLESAETGETAVVRWTQVNLDGSVVWSSSAAHRVIYPAAGWAVIGQAAL